MEFSLKAPMSIDEYKNRMFFPSGWRVAMIALVGATFIIMLLLIGADHRVERYTFYGIVVLFAAFTSWTALQTQYNVNNEWHLFRGHVDDVELPQSESGDVRVWFEGDEENEYTIFTAADYAAHRELLRPGKLNVLIVRRSVKRGSPAFQGAFHS